MLALGLTLSGQAEPRNLMLNLPQAQVDRLASLLGIELDREELVDLIQNRLAQDFGWTGLVYVSDKYAEGATLYQSTAHLFQLNGIFSFDEMEAQGKRVGGLSSGHVGRVSIPEIRRVVARKNLDERQTKTLLCNLVLHEWIGHGVSDSSAFHGSPPMGPSIRGMLPAIANEVLHFQQQDAADAQIYRKIRLQLGCP